MTLEPSLHKQRGDFSHNYKKIRIKCPECIRTIKGRNHVKVYKNLAGLWRHIRHEHGEIVNSVFNIKQIREVLTSIAIAIEWGMLSDSWAIDTTTSLSILYNGKRPRTDVRIKLQEIAYLLKIQSEIYPIYRLKLLSTLVAKVLGSVDNRTFKNYIDCVISASEADKMHGTYNVTGFCISFDEHEDINRNKSKLTLETV